ncbi:hypothetical protein [Nocardioides lijunqiniae]|uniref:hypothetical protein n=1 Tax=Nocardioides lijunqiniae TaxID=2760832 RepID=UPI001878E49E|nr:hypothetical protein [Nocardioides lijunqiniae]
MAVRTVEASDPRIDDQSLNRMKLGIYADINTTVAMQYRMLSPYTTAPEIRWAIDFAPEAEVDMRATLLLMSGGPLYEINIDKPLTIVAILPKGAQWGTKSSDVMPNGLNCASWYDGKDVKVAHPVFHRVHDGTVALICKVPAVGKMQQLTFDLRVRFHDTVWERFGFGRAQGGLRFDSSWMPDADMAEQGLTYMLRHPVEVKLQLPAAVELSESFPEPTGGSAGVRSWRLGTGLGSAAGNDLDGEDITYRLDDPQKRIWIQPVLDLSLLLAGVVLGLLPALLRRSTPRSSQRA